MNTLFAVEPSVPALGPRLAELRPYQQDMKTGIDACRFGRPRPSADPLPDGTYPAEKAVAMVMKTGAGKTVTSCDYIRDEIELRGARRVYIVVHRDALAKQTKKTLHSLMPGVRIGMEKAEQRMSPLDTVVIVSIQTAKGERLKRMPRPDMIWVDETHHIAAPSYQAALEHWGHFDEENPTFLLGATATLIRGDSKSLGKTFRPSGVVEGPSLLWLIKHGFLVAPRRIRIKNENLHLEDVKFSRGDMAAGSLGQALSDGGSPKLVAEALVEHALQGRPLIFSPIKDVAQEVKDELEARPELAHFSRICELITEETGQTEDAFGKSERDYIRDRHQSGETYAVSNVMVMTEGTDWPWVDTVVINRPTNNPGLYEQMVGRGLRTSKATGKKDCLILEVAGGEKRRLVTLIDLLVNEMPQAKDRDLKDDEDLLEAEQRIKKEFLAPLDDDGELVSEDTTDTLFEDSPYNWDFTEGKKVPYIRTAAGVYCLWPKDGAENLLRIPKNGRRLVWRNGEYHSDAVVVNLGTEENPIPATGLSRGWAMKWAEKMAGAEDEYLARSAKTRFGKGASIATRDAKWRKGPVSQSQIDALARWGIGVLPGTTAGEASDKISNLEASAAIDPDY